MRIRRVRYCSTAHQRADFASHKLVCKPWAAHRAAFPTSTYPVPPTLPPNEVALRVIHDHVVDGLLASLERAIGSDRIDEVAKYVVMREPRCAWCKRVAVQTSTDKLVMCMTCEVMGWCRAGTCAADGRVAHEEHGACDLAREVAEDDDYLQSVAPAVRSVAS